MRLNKSHVVIFAFTISVFSHAFGQSFDWCITMGKDANEMVESLAIDKDGNVYATGFFRSEVADFDPGPDVHNLINTSTAQDVFICKYSSRGELIWAKSIGSGSTDKVNDIAIDQHNNVYITGYFYQTVDFDPGPGTYNIQAVDADTYVLKLDAAGNFKWAKSFSGDRWSEGFGVDVSESGNVHVVGRYRGTIDLNPDEDAEYICDATYLNAGYDFFVVKLDSVGDFLWGHGFGSAGDDAARDLAILDNEDIIITGDFRNTIDFDPGAEEYLLTANSSKRDMFLLKLAANGSFIWANKYGDGGNVFSESMVVDNENQILVIGIFNQDPVFTVEGVEVELNELSHSDMYILSADEEGFVKWIKVIHSENQIYPYSIAVDSANNVFTTGFFHVAADLNPGSDTQWETATDESYMPSVAFVLKLTSSGSFEWAHAIGENKSVMGTSIAVSNYGEILIGGGVSSTQNMAPSPEEHYINISDSSKSDAFILKWNEGSVIRPKPKINCDFKIYPNPAQSSIFASCEGEAGLLQVFSSTGSTLMEYWVEDGQHEVELPVSSLNVGLYLIRFTSDENQSVRKFEKF